LGEFAVSESDSKYKHGWDLCNESSGESVQFYFEKKLAGKVIRRLNGRFGWDLFEGDREKGEAETLEAALERAWAVYSLTRLLNVLCPPRDRLGERESN
jgi:hypothetical protein